MEQNETTTATTKSTADQLIEKQIAEVRAEWSARLADAQRAAQSRHEQTLEQIDELTNGVASNQIGINDIKERLESTAARTSDELDELHKKLHGIQEDLHPEPKGFVGKANKHIRDIADVVAPYVFLGATAYLLGHGVSQLKDRWSSKKPVAVPVTVVGSE
jgi:ABC-type transporter Mla subunit MlaD